MFTLGNFEKIGVGQDSPCHSTRPTAMLRSFERHVTVTACAMMILATGHYAEAFDRTSYLGRSDPVWEWNFADPSSIPKLWFEGPFVGNGMVGAYATISSNNEVIFEIGRVDLWDVRLPKSDYAENRLYSDTPRLGCGTLRLHALDDNLKITGGTARLYLANATMKLSLIATAKNVSVTVLDINVIAASGRPEILYFQTEGSAAVNFTFTPRTTDETRSPSTYVKNPAPNCTSEIVSEDARLRLGADRASVTHRLICEQQLLAGGGFATAIVHEVPEGAGTDGNAVGTTTGTIVVSVANSVPGGVPTGQSATNLAEAAVGSALTDGWETIHAAHTAWWLRYWGQSMVSVPDAMVESFLQLQLYKAGSAMRCDDSTCWAYDLQGPWFAPSRWPDYHWDLNVQMSYWLVLPANQAQLGYSLANMVQRNLPTLAASVPPEFQHDSAALAANTGFNQKSTCDSYLVTAVHNTSLCYEYFNASNGGGPVQLGDLPWVAHNLWLQYRYTQNITLLREVVLPVLRKSMQYYMHLMTENVTTGRLHLPAAQSPEYATAPDTNYDLALFRWGVGTLVHVATHVLPDLRGDPDLPKWQNVIERLTDFPTDSETGLLIGDGVQVSLFCA
eukprot:m.1418277 g.1418277  ORF g.1418277 m.1418277 type:complete len:618 (-) comp25038_c0_seq11:7083-8936(-)